MKYTLFKQNYGSPTSFDGVKVTDELPIVFEYDGERGELTAKVISIGGLVHYAKIVDGVANIPRRYLRGKVKLSVVSSSGVIPCVGLIAVDDGKATVVYPDPSEVFDRLHSCEEDISMTVDALKALERKYNDIIARLDKLFSGYNI
jgi:hypothetical protein